MSSEKGVPLGHPLWPQALSITQPRTHRSTHLAQALDSRLQTLCPPIHSGSSQESQTQPSGGLLGPRSRQRSPSRALPPPRQRLTLFLALGRMPMVPKISS
ncbi:unnamed protein product, partial [Gulo gulo]